MRFYNHNYNFEFARDGGTRLYDILLDRTDNVPIHGRRRAHRGVPARRVGAARGLLSADEVETLRAGVERNLADLGPLGMNATKPGEPGAFVEDFRNWQRIPEYEQVFRDSALAAAGAR